jgi:hypothetical protein
MRLRGSTSVVLPRNARRSAGNARERGRSDRPQAILELDSPFAGLLQISDAPLRNAITHIGM